MDYVLGFVFDKTKKNVLLINKNKPEWQKGKMNGLGGKIESFDSSPEHAMIREMKEESGLDIPSWDPVCLFQGTQGTWKVYVFTAITDITKFKNTTSEKCEIVSVNKLPDNVIDNLRWVIPMCFDKTIHNNASVINFW